MTKSSKSRVVRRKGQELVTARKSSAVASRHVASRLLPLMAKQPPSLAASLQTWSRPSPGEMYNRFAKMGEVTSEIVARFEESEQDRIIGSMAAIQTAMIPMRLTQNKALPKILEIYHAFQSLLGGTRPSTFEPVSFAPGKATDAIDRIIGIAEVAAVFEAECLLCGSRAKAAEKVVTDLTEALGQSRTSLLFNTHAIDDVAVQSTSSNLDKHCRTLKRYQKALAAGETLGQVIPGLPLRDVQIYRGLTQLLDQIRDQAGFIQDHYCPTHFKSAVAKLRRAVIPRA